MVGSDAAARGVGHESHTGVEAGAQLSGEPYWLKLWAYGRSPYGLGLTDADFWELGFREFEALRKQHRMALERWALERAMFANVWRKPDTPAFHPDDFLEGAAARTQRVLDYRKEREEVLLANAQLAHIRQGQPPTDEVPEWARGPYQGVS